MINELKRRASIVAKDAKVAVELLWESPSVMARFDQTGALTREICNQIGLVGVAARACGIPRDVRQDFPSGIYRFAQIPVSTWHTGDVFARAYVRWLEIQRSLAFVDEQLDSLPEGPIFETIGPLQPDSVPWLRLPKDGAEKSATLPRPTRRDVGNNIKLSIHHFITGLDLPWP